MRVVRFAGRRPATNLVNDLPLEAWLYPNSWGEFTLE